MDGGGQTRGLASVWILSFGLLRHEIFFPEAQKCVNTVETDAVTVDRLQMEAAAGETGSTQEPFTVPVTHPTAGDSRPGLKHHVVPPPPLHPGENVCLSVCVF